MAKFLTTTGISHELEELIKDAEEWLLLISPFLQVNQRIRDLLTHKDKSNVIVEVVYGKSELSPEESDWLSSTPSIRTSYRTNLHAKCYLSEKKALLTSMNLYAFSQVNNLEMGVLVDRHEELYGAMHEEARRILEGAEEHRSPSAPTRSPRQRQKRVPRSKRAEPEREPARRGHRSGESPKKISRTAPAKARDGFCIRCSAKLPLDPTTPYCSTCHQSWSRYKNDSYTERVCHICGEAFETTMRRPACLLCYRKHKSNLRFSSEPS